MLLLIVILTIVLSAMVIIGLAFTDDNTDKYTTAPSNEVIKSIAESAVSSNSAYIQENELNGLLAYLIDVGSDINSETSDYRLTAAYIDLKADAPSKLYFQIEYRGRPLGFTAEVDTILDEINGEIKLTLSNATVGRLQIPDFITEYLLDQAKIGTLPSVVSVDNMTITLATSYMVSVDGFGDLAKLEIVDMEINDNEVFIQTNPIIFDMIGNLAEQYSDEIDSLVDWFGDFFE